MNLIGLRVLAVALSLLNLHAVRAAIPASSMCSLAPAPNEFPRRGTVAWIRSMVRSSDAVVRATAMGPDSIPPAAADDRLDELFPGFHPHYYPAVRFKVDEVIHGTRVPGFLRLQGGTDSTDDYNDQPVPYTFVRPSGRHGSCYAFGYRIDAHYLLLLRRDTANRWHLRRVALAPVNEQVHGPNDAWVRWVRALFADRTR